MIFGGRKGKGKVKMKKESKINTSCSDDKKEPFLKRMGLSKSSILHGCRVTLVLCILVLAFLVWPEAHAVSYGKFRLQMAWLSQPELYTELLPLTFSLRWAEGNRLFLVIELVVIVLAIWKIFIRFAWIAFIRARSLFMICVSSYWIWIWLYDILNIDKAGWWEKWTVFYESNWLFAREMFLPIWNDSIMMQVVPVLGVYLALYLLTKGNSIIGGEGLRLNKKQLEEYRLYDVMKKARGWRVFFATPRIYITDRFQHHGYCSGNVIVLATDLLNDETVSQGVLAHELGHFYHHDCAVDFICRTCLNAFLFPVTTLAFLMKPLARIPIFGVFAVMTALITQIAIACYAFVMGILNKMFYWVDGRWAERRADIFAVDIGYGIGLYIFFLNESSSSWFERLIDVHPNSKKRRAYIKQRIIDNWGEKYWQSLQVKYGLKKYS